MLTHAWGLVVNPNARIGNNVTLFHGVTIGRKDRISVDGGRSSECPDICDDVWIGPHAIIVGGITLGQGCRVAGGAYVTKSVAPYTIVSGNPAVIIKENCLADVVFRAPL
jgi:serine O-acetyltransferase